MNFGEVRRAQLAKSTLLTSMLSTALGQVVACAPVAQRARVRSPVGTSFLGEVSSKFFPVRQMSGSFRPQGPLISFGHHYYHESSFITDANDLRSWRALKTSNIHIPPCWGHWDLFRSFKVCADAKEKMVCGKQREANERIYP